MAMQQQQMKYALRRLEEIFAEKQQSIREECTDTSKRLTGERLASLIKSGKVKVRDDATDTVITNYTDVTSVFDCYKLISTNDELDRKTYDKRTKALKQEYTRVNDELVLGDVARAMELLQSFAGKVF
jgi:hypothetical protein